jgi:hypothetical protein
MLMNQMILTFLQYVITFISNKAATYSTTGKHHSFVGFLKFFSSDEYIQITFIGFETDECNIIFVSLGQEPMNIWVVRFDFDWPHIFVSDMVYIHRLTDEYIGRRAAVTGTPVFVG